MRFGTPILPATFLCLLALVIWQTSHALPGYCLDVIGHLVELSHNSYDFRLWLGLLGGPLKPRLTLVILYMASGRAIGTAYGVCMQLWNGHRLLTYIRF